MLSTKTVSSFDLSRPGPLLGLVLRATDLYDLCPGISDRRGCGRRVEQGNQFCPRHICQFHDCQAPRTRSSEFCIDHKCLAAECGRPRQTQLHGLVRRDTNKPFCGEHTCRHVGCHNQAAEDSDKCLPHDGGLMPRFRPRLADIADEIPRGGRAYMRDQINYQGNGEDRRQHRQRHLGWAEARRDPWAAWGAAM
jgi:hypothetical protein